MFRWLADDLPCKSIRAASSRESEVQPEKWSLDEVQGIP
jgi:hypothetical protein